jgi:hypothetical protein
MVGRMKSILKALLGAAISGAIFGALLRKLANGRRNVPTVNPVSDAGPNVEEPLQESDLRVAQNTPL